MTMKDYNHARSHVYIREEISSEVALFFALLAFILTWFTMIRCC